MKISGVVLLLVLVAFALALWMFGKKGRTGMRALTPGEIEIRDLIREVYGTNIVSESFVPKGNDMALVVALKNEKLESLQINLSSLARKHKEGASLPALKASLRFD